MVKWRVLARNFFGGSTLPILDRGLNLLTQVQTNVLTTNSAVIVVTTGLPWELEFFSLGTVLYAESPASLALNPNSVVELFDLRYARQMTRYPVLFAGNLFRGIFIDASRSGEGLEVVGSLTFV